MDSFASAIGGLSRHTSSVLHTKASHRTLRLGTLRRMIHEQHTNPMLRRTMQEEAWCQLVLRSLGHNHTFVFEALTLRMPTFFNEPARTTLDIPFRALVHRCPPHLLGVLLVSLLRAAPTAPAVTGVVFDIAIRTCWERLVSCCSSNESAFVDALRCAAPSAEQSDVASSRNGPQLPRRWTTALRRRRYRYSAARKRSREVDAVPRRRALRQTLAVYASTSAVTVDGERCGISCDTLKFTLLVCHAVLIAASVVPLYRHVPRHRAKPEFDARRGDAASAMLARCACRAIEAALTDASQGSASSSSMQVHGLSSPPHEDILQLLRCASLLYVHHCVPRDVARERPVLAAATLLRRLISTAVPQTSTRTHVEPVSLSTEEPRGAAAVRSTRRLSIFGERAALVLPVFPTVAKGLLIAPLSNGDRPLSPSIDLLSRLLSHTDALQLASVRLEAVRIVEEVSQWILAGAQVKGSLNPYWCCVVLLSSIARCPSLAPFADVDSALLSSDADSACSAEARRPPVSPMHRLLRGIAILVNYIQAFIPPRLESLDPSSRETAVWPIATTPDGLSRRCIVDNVVKPSQQWTSDVPAAVVRCLQPLRLRTSFQGYIAIETVSSPKSDSRYGFVSAEGLITQLRCHISLAELVSRLSHRVASLPYFSLDQQSEIVKLQGELVANLKNVSLYILRTLVEGWNSTSAFATIEQQIVDTDPVDVTADLCARQYMPSSRANPFSPSLAAGLFGSVEPFVIVSPPLFSILQLYYGSHARLYGTVAWPRIPIRLPSIGPLLMTFFQSLYGLVVTSNHFRPPAAGFSAHSSCSSAIQAQAQGVHPVLQDDVFVHHVAECFRKLWMMHPCIFEESFRSPSYSSFEPLTALIELFGGDAFAFPILHVVVCIDWSTLCRTRRCRHRLTRGQLAAIKSSKTPCSYWRVRKFVTTKRQFDVGRSNYLTADSSHFALCVYFPDGTAGTTPSEGRVLARSLRRDLHLPVVTFNTPHYVARFGYSYCAAYTELRKYFVRLFVKATVQYYRTR